MDSERIVDTTLKGRTTSQTTNAPEVRVITFDLDNTLWDTGATISAANDALADFLDEHKIVQPKRIEQIMGDLFRASKTTYAPLDAESAKAPVLLTQLRKDALLQILVDDNDFTPEDAEEFANEAFQKVCQNGQGSRDRPASGVSLFNDVFFLLSPVVGWTLQVDRIQFCHECRGSI